MNLTYILVDFENLKPKAVEWKSVVGTNYRVLIFHGSHQNKFDSDMVNALQPMGERAEYIQCERRGKNALDFRMAFYLGRLVQAQSLEPSSLMGRPAFAVVSKDGDLDRLLEHIQSLGFRAGRGTSIQAAIEFKLPEAERLDAGPEARKIAKETEESPATVEKPVTSAVKKKAAPPIAPSAPTKRQDSWTHVVGHLRDHPHNRPATVARLERHLKTFLGPETTEKIAKDLAARLLREGLIVLNGKKLEYMLPEESK